MPKPVIVFNKGYPIHGPADFYKAFDKVPHKQLLNNSQLNEINTC